MDPEKETSIKNEIDRDNLEPNSDNVPLVKPEQSKKANLIEEIHEQYGYGWITIKVIIIAFVNMFANGFCRTFLASFIIPVKAYFDVGDGTMEWIAFLFLISSSLGMFFYSPIQKLGRYLIINILIFILILSHLMLFNHSLEVFILSRLLMGLSTGIFSPISFNVLVESIPARNRGFCLNAIWIGYGLGLSVPLVVMLFTMPNLEPEDLQKTYWVLFAIPVGTQILNLLFLKDSPRSLIINNKYKEAFKCLDEMRGESLTQYEKTMIIEQVTSGANKKVGSSVSDLFTRYKKLTIIMLIVTVIVYVCFHGTFILVSMTLQELQPKNETKRNENVIIQQLIICLIKEIYIFFGFLTEVKCLGRLGTMILALSFGLINLILFLILPHFATIFLGLFLASSALTFTIFFMYQAEVYPTTLRDTSNIIFKSTGSIAGSISQFIYLGLNSHGVLAPYYFTVALIVCNIISIFFIPFETQSVPLDTIEEKKLRNN